MLEKLNNVVQKVNLSDFSDDSLKKFSNSFYPNTLNPELYNNIFSNCCSILPSVSTYFIKTTSTNTTTTNLATTPNGVVEDFRQGGIGDCWYLASVKSISVSVLGQQLLSSIIGINSNSLTVKFQATPAYTYSTTLTNLLSEINDGDTYTSNGHSSGDADTLLLEMSLKAYVSDSTAKNSTFTSSPFSGGWMSQALSLLTGKASTTYNNWSNNLTATSAKLNELAHIIDHTAITAACMNGANTSLDIAASSHAYSIVAIDSVNKTVSFRNPWYSGTVLKKISYADFSTYFQRIDYVDLTSNNLYLLATNAGSALTGSTGKDMLYGGSGSDTLNGSSGVDTMYGGSGNDIYYVDNAKDAISEYSNGGTDTIISSFSLNLQNYAYSENLTLTGSCNLSGYGNSYNNTIIGNTGNNYLYGDYGNDVLDGGRGADTLSGYTGNDTYYVDNSYDSIIEYNNYGTDTVYSSISYTLGSNLENLILSGSTAVFGTGNALNNKITGNSANNVLNGLFGADTMNGNAGNDNYYVDNSGDIVYENLNEGTDTIYSSISYTLGNNIENLTLNGTSCINATGNNLSNVITGNTANNTINGSIGNDSLFGGSGNDTYIFGSGYGQDYILDTAGCDKVKFGTDVSKNSIAVFKSGSSLIFKYSGQNAITIGAQSYSSYVIEKYELADGSYLTNSDINSIIQQMSTYATTNGMQITSVNSVASNENLMNIVSNSWHTV